MHPPNIQPADALKAQDLAGPEFGVEWTEKARSYLPLFEHLPLSELEKVQLISDFLIVIDHVFDAYLAEAAAMPILPSNAAASGSRNDSIL